jgi:hypothetical protein
MSECGNKKVVPAATPRPQVLDCLCYDRSASYPVLFILAQQDLIGKLAAPPRGARDSRNSAAPDSLWIPPLDFCSRCAIIGSLLNVLTYSLVRLD